METPGFPAHCPPPWYAGTMIPHGDTTSRKPQQPPPYRKQKNLILDADMGHGRSGAVRSSCSSKFSLTSFSNVRRRQAFLEGNRGGGGASGLRTRAWSIRASQHPAIPRNASSCGKSEKPDLFVGMTAITTLFWLASSPTCRPFGPLYAADRIYHANFFEPVRDQ